MDKLYLARQVNRALQLLSTLVEMDDSQVMEIADVYPAWTFPKRYAPGEIVKYGVNHDGETQLYRVIQEHTSQEGWVPDTVPALFGRIGFAGDGTPVWTQPSGAHDAYMKGDKVSHGGRTWTSDVDGNVWEPGVYGWTEVV